ncbi:uncharacterized protein N7503_012069 [Penicillium pulvis]|uniref:uncharacterized protein n=1 Tax=Penicillium pulvis TaxID=1562058 RepID=UPI00254693B7|nr:uncharacterized protein N7503_012069 [Penicillium pulvis]KAJ5786857.1 hypothetical protein N7503_012069 [Penicillium pulvis]
MDASTGGVPLSLVVSDDGLFAAHVSGKDLVVHSNPTAEHKDMQSARMKETTVKSLKFCPSKATHNNINRHLLITNESRISVWQLEPLQLVAEIENVEPGTLNVEFGGDENEVLVFHAWNNKMAIHSIETGQISVVKTPKFPHPLGFGYRPITRKHLAIILKPDASDTLTIHELPSYELLNRTVLPTIDAQGLKWSPDGKWIAVWDTPSSGTKVLILTADGQMFRTYNGPAGVDDAFDLGVKQIEWSAAAGPSGVSETLAVGKINGNIDLLRTRTFSSSTTLSHVFPMDQNSPTIWRERSTSAMGDAEYAETTSSSAFNMSPESPGPPRGVAIMTFSPDGTLLATVDTMRSNVVWIWALDITPRLASVLVHEHAVRQVLWHPSTPQLLINSITNNLPVVRWWSPQSHPVIARVPTQKCDSGKYEVKWLVGEEHDSAFWFGSSEEYVVGYLSADENSVQFEVLNSFANRGPPTGSISR